MKIEDVEGIGPVYATKLSEAGVDTTDDLLEHGATAAGRSTLEGSTGISSGVLLGWVNHVDLMRIKGVGSEYSDLLEAAGVDSPSELAQRNATNLADDVPGSRRGAPRQGPPDPDGGRGPGLDRPGQDAREGRLALDASHVASHTRTDAGHHVA